MKWASFIRRKMADDIKARLAEEIQKREDRIQFLEEKKYQIDQDISRNRAEINVLEEWVREPPEFLAQFTFNGGSSDKPSPTEAVDQIVNENPGIQRSTVLDELEGNVDSDSPNVRSIISSAISRRIKSEDIWQDEDDKDRLWPWEHDEAVRRREEAERKRRRLHVGSSREERADGSQQKETPTPVRADVGAEAE